MKKVLFFTVMGVLAFNISNAIVLFPFFTDLAPNYKTIDRIVVDEKFEQILHKGESNWGGIDECVSFLNDVLPKDVNKQSLGKNFVVYTSTFHPKEIDVIKDDNKVSAIYIVKKGKSAIIFYSESDDTQQKAWQSAIESGKMD